MVSAEARRACLMPRNISTALLSLIIMAGVVSAQQKATDPNKFAVIINGPGGETAYAQQFEEWTRQLRSALTDKFGFDGKNIRILSEKADAGNARSTAE